MPNTNILQHKENLGRCCPISSNALALASLRFIKLRSGTAATPVNQVAARTITLSLKR